MSSINKIVFGAKVLIDLTEDTVTADTLVEGVTAHDKSGAKIVGTYKPQTSQDLINFIEGNISGEYIIPEGTSKIGYAKFMNQKGLTYVKIPDSVQLIDSLAFANISNCTFDFTGCTDIPTLLSEDVFTLSDNILIKVPETLYAEWIAANVWSKFSSIIYIEKLATPEIEIKQKLEVPEIYLQVVE